MYGRLPSNSTVELKWWYTVYVELILPYKSL